MAHQFAGRFYEALFDSKSKLLKNTVFYVYTDAAATTLATTYTDRTKSTQATVLATDFLGNAEFYADPGFYYLQIDEDLPIVKVGVYEDVADTADVDALDTVVAALDGKQPIDSDLSAIAALIASNDDFIQRKAGAWTNRTVAQVKADLGISSITGQYLGSAATFAGLPTTDASSNAASNGDWAVLTSAVIGTGTTQNPQYPRAIYIYNGSTFSLGLSIGADFVVGTIAGTLAAGNDARIVGARQRFVDQGAPKTSSYSMAVWHSARFNCSATSIAQPLPATAIAGDEVELHLDATSGSNALTATFGGSTVATLSVAGHGITLRFDGTVWRDGPDRKTLASQDARYASSASQKASSRRAAPGLIPATPISARPAMLSSTRTDAGMSSAIAHRTQFAGANFQLVYPNWHSANDGGPTAAIKVQASIEYPLGTYYRVHFSAEDSTAAVSIPPGVTIASLPLGIDIPDNTVFYVHTTVVPGSGASYPIGNAKGLIAWVGTDKATLNSATDYTLSVQPSPSVSDQFAYGPLAVCAIPTGGTHKRIIALMGDSYSQGVGDNDRPSTGRETGWLVKSMDTSGVGYLMFGVNGQQAASWATAANCIHRLEIGGSLTDVVLSLGYNDVHATANSVATMQSQLLTIYNAFANRGVRVWTHTLPPRTTSTDSWATTTNQTAYSSRLGPEGSAPGSVWMQMNTWLRTIPAPLSGVFDLASVVTVYQSTNDSWVWRAGYTGDGIHPNATGHAAALAANLMTPLLNSLAI